MKCNKKVVALNLLASVLITNTAFARIEGVRGSRSSSSGSSSGNGRAQEVKISVAKPEQGTVVKPVLVADCNKNVEVAKYFPQSLFHNITRDGDDISIEKRDNNKVIIKIPSILNVCGNFVPELRQNKDSKDVTVLMKLVGRKNDSDVDLTYKEFEDCLANTKITTKVDGVDVEKPIMVDGKINHDMIPGKMYSEKIYSMDYEFDKKQDVTKTVKLSFGYPTEFDDPNNGYGPLHAFDPKATLAGDTCVKAETVGSKEPFYINEGREVLLRKIYTACGNGKDAISEARASLGNADALKDIAEKLRAELDAAYLVAVKTDVERIFKDMGKIEDRLIKTRANITEANAKKDIAKYAELAKELDNIFLEKAITRLDLLMQKRETLEEDSEAMAALDKEIKKLNEEIGAFSKRSAASLDTVYFLMEKFAITDHASTIEAILLKSSAYAKVYGESPDERGRPNTIETANEEQASKHKKFDRVLVDWKDVYAAGKGSSFPIQKTQRERDAIVKKVNARMSAYEKKEQSDYSNYCAVGWTGAVKNQVKCKEFYSGMEKRRQREAKKVQKDLDVLNRKDAKLNKMGVSYGEYERKVASDADRDSDRYDSYGSSYSGYEDDFSDRFPGYYGPRVTSAYDPSLYNMGGMSNSMNMGQGMQQMGGFQGQGGGWPGLP
ncbi:MAG: hypothetical protein HOP07_09540 [Bacteriovoracaceae bacterium]|nr:hypothetical protein [Bacteriovoracaceae bacterium]